MIDTNTTQYCNGCTQPIQYDKKNEKLSYKNWHKRDTLSLFWTV